MDDLSNSVNSIIINTAAQTNTTCTTISIKMA
uniref:Uncharacterized protein n=1 Tax=Tetranychus urticae TaxID=32264 RepID=T1KM61_TETUR